MQSALEQECKGKAEAIRMKKKLESDVLDLETSLEHANAANQETQKTIKRYHQQIREAQARLEEEQRTNWRNDVKQTIFSFTNLVATSVKRKKHHKKNPRPPWQE